MVRSTRAARAAAARRSTGHPSTWRVGPGGRDLTGRVVDVIDWLDAVTVEVVDAGHCAEHVGVDVELTLDRMGL